MSSSKEQKCPECGSLKLVYDRDSGETVCEDCGLVVYEHEIVNTPEWRSFDNEQMARRERAYTINLRLHNKGLGSVIDYRDLDYFKRPIKPNRRLETYRLRKWQRKSVAKDATERKLISALNDIERIGGGILNLPKNVIETASVIYQTSQKNGILIGRDSRELAAAITYLACRQCNVARTIKEVSNAFNVRKKELGKSYRHILKENDYKVNMQDSLKFLNKICKYPKQEEIVIKILNVAKEQKITSGRAPTGITAASAYIAGQLISSDETQYKVAKKADVTEVTLRNRYKELMKRLIIETFH
ncbi:MAG: TFIIB-type zinc ribbon-containing protein [Candidatus Aenigmatarchaeota archaeon]